MKQRHESVESYLRRGGTITKIPHELNTIGSIWNQLGLTAQENESSRKLNTRAMQWKSMQPDERFDMDEDDRKYWNKLNKRCDKILKKIKSEKIKSGLRNKRKKT